MNLAGEMAPKKRQKTGREERKKEKKIKDVRRSAFGQTAFNHKSTCFWSAFNPFNNPRRTLQNLPLLSINHNPCSQHSWDMTQSLDSCDQNMRKGLHPYPIATPSTFRVRDNQQPGQSNITTELADTHRRLQEQFKERSEMQSQSDTSA
jgi:hypothetical protein